MATEPRAEAFCIKLAGKVIRIEPIYAYMQEYCKGYVTEEEADFTVRTEISDIFYEREKSAREDEKEGIPVRKFSDEYLEALAVYRKIAGKLLESDTVLFHGSVVAVDGKGYLFTAKSGTGKSTHTKLWREYFGSRAVMINDDKPLLQITEHGVMVCGTPWMGKHNLGTNTSVPLKAICVLHRDNENHIQKVNPREVYSMLLQQVYRPAGGREMQQTMMLIDRLMENTEFYCLGCNRNPEAALVAYEGMKNA